MSRFVLAASLVAAVALAACSAAPIPPAASPSADQALPSTPPSASPAVTPEPSQAPDPATTPEPADPEPPAATPAPSAADYTAGERYLQGGVRRGAINCEPAAGSADLPRGAIAGLECSSNDPAVARVGFYLFRDDADMLAAYEFRMHAEGIAMDSGSCRNGEREGAYMPGEGIVPSRNGCFVNGDGRANYRATLAGAHVYIGILGRTASMTDLEDFAWVGNQDVPGAPTLWRPAS